MSPVSEGGEVVGGQHSEYRGGGTLKVLYRVMLRGTHCVVMYCSTATSGNVSPKVLRTPRWRIPDQIPLYHVGLFSKR